MYLYQIKLDGTDAGAGVTTPLFIEFAAPPGSCSEGCSFTVTSSSLSPATSYDLQLAALNDLGYTSRFSIPTELTLAPTVPSAVVGLNVTDVTSSTLTLEWSAPEANGAPILNFTLFTCDDELGACVSEGVANTSTSASVSGLLPGFNYTVSIVATNAVGSSASASAPGTFTTLAPPLRGYAPFQAPALEGLDQTTSLHVMWYGPYDNGAPLTGYELLLADGTVHQLNATSSPQFFLGGLEPGTSHTFSVRAINAEGFGQYSDPLELTTNPSVPGRPLSAPNVQPGLDPSVLVLQVAAASYSGGYPVLHYQLHWFTEEGEQVATVSGGLYHTLQRRTDLTSSAERWW